MVRSLPQMLRERVRLIPSTIAQYAKDDTGRFQSKTYWEFYCEICDTAAGLLELGVKRGDHIGLISDNRQEWLVTDFAIMTIGAADVPRGCDSIEQEIAYILGFTGCAFTFTEDSKQIDKILAHKENMPLLNTVIAYDPINEKTLAAAEKAGARVISFQEILAMGKKRQAERPGEVEAEMNKGQEEDLATIIFTSGSTGEPKGVMLTHGTFLFQLPSFSRIFDTKTGDIWLSVLPVWHVFERAMEYIIFYLNGTLAYSKPISSVLLEDFQIVRPHWMVGVPRIWESIMDWANRIVRQRSRTLKKAFDFFVAIGIIYTYFRDLTFGLLPNFHGRVRFLDAFLGFIPWLLLCPIRGFTAALAFRRIKKRLGGRFKAGMSGGGSLPVKVDHFFNAIGIRIQEGYGLTETSPVVSVRRYYASRRHTVGQLLLNTEARIVDDKGTILPPGHSGHIQVRGGQIMKGYYRKPEETAKVLSSDGWLETGDLGMLTHDQELRITGRVKDTIVLRGGENVEPVPIEHKIQESPWVAQCMVVGQDQKYLAAIIVPVQDAVMAFAEENNIPIVDYELLLQQPEINELVADDLAALVGPSTGFKPFERVFKFKLIPKPFEPGIELNSKMELKRSRLYARYAREIHSLFKS